MKKTERCRENKLRESKVGGKKCVDFYQKGKLLYYYRTYQNGKMTLLLWNGESICLSICDLVMWSGLVGSKWAAVDVVDGLASWASSDAFILLGWLIYIDG